MVPWTIDGGKVSGGGLLGAVYSYLWLLTKLDITYIEHCLEIYDLQDIFDLNDVTEADVLMFLVEQEFLRLPEHLPLGEL